MMPARGHLSWKRGVGEDQGPSIVTGDGSSPARTLDTWVLTFLAPSLAVWPWHSLCPSLGLGTHLGTWAPAQPHPAPHGCSPGAGPACRRRRSSSAGGCGSNVGGPGRTAGCSPCGGGQQTEKVLLWVPPAAQGPTPPSRKTSRPQDQLHSSAAAAPRCPTCSGHSPDLRRLHQSLRTPLVPRCPAQAAGGARIRRHQKQAPADAVTVHACGAVGSSSSSQPGPQIPGPPPPPHRLVQRDTHRTQTRTCAPGTALSTPPAPAGRTVRPHIAHTHWRLHTRKRHVCKHETWLHTLTSVNAHARAYAGHHTQEAHTYIHVHGPHTRCTHVCAPYAADATPKPRLRCSRD